MAGRYPIPRFRGPHHAPSGSPHRPPSAFGRGADGPPASRGRSSGSGRDNSSDVAKSTSKFQEILDGVNSVVGIINGVLELASHIPLIGELIERLNNLIRRMFEKVNEAVSKTAEIFAYVGSPTTLRQTGLSWVESVGAPATQATSTIVPSSLPTTGNWEGKAHNAYIARVELQQPAAEDVYDKCVMIDEQLNTFADAIVDFWVGFSIGVLTAAIGVAAAIIEIASLAGAPIGVGTIIVDILAFTADVVNLVSIIMTANQAASDFMMEVTNSLASSGAFPSGAWPRHAAA